MVKKVSVDATVRINAYPIIQDAVANGVAYGVRRAFKHTDKPSEDTISTEVENAVMSEICEILQFGNSECGCESCEK